MNCENMQKELLLSQTGELTADEATQLQEHLRDCADCRAYRASVENAMRLARTSQEAEGPDEAVMNRIRAVAREEVTCTPVMFPVYSARWIACAAAAAFLICGAVMWSVVRQQVHPASQVCAILMAVGSDAELHAISHSGKAEKGQELQALASHLLLMEGFSADELVPVEPDVSDAADEPQPTALQWRNTDVSDLERCV